MVSALFGIFFSLLAVSVAQTDWRRRKGRIIEPDSLLSFGLPARRPAAHSNKPILPKWPLASRWSLAASDQLALQMPTPAAQVTKPVGLSDSTKQRLRAPYGYTGWAGVPGRQGQKLLRDLDISRFSCLSVRPLLTETELLMSNQSQIKM